MVTQPTLDSPAWVGLFMAVGIEQFGAASKGLEAGGVIDALAEAADELAVVSIMSNSEYFRGYFSSSQSTSSSSASPPPSSGSPG